MNRRPPPVELTDTLAQKSGNIIDLIPFLECRIFPIVPFLLRLLLAKKMRNFFALVLLLLISSCKSASGKVEREEALIIETLQQETKYFCERKLGKWEEQWSRQPFVSKMYTGNTEFKEFLGWEAVQQNTVDHIRDYPDPIPVPVVDQSYTITVFQETALVLYTKMGEKGPVRETRFMVKEGEKWKIARMQTIY